MSSVLPGVTEFCMVIQNCPATTTHGSAADRVQAGALPPAGAGSRPDGEVQGEVAGPGSGESSASTRSPSDPGPAARAFPWRPASRHVRTACVASLLLGWRALVRVLASLFLPVPDVPEVDGVRVAVPGQAELPAAWRRDFDFGRVDLTRRRIGWPGG